MERRLDRMRYPQVRAYLERSDAIIFPVGTTEVHGVHAPLGTDRLVAEAVAAMAAEQADALIAPPLAYTWAGATASLVGSISLPAETVIGLVRQLCLAFAEHGFHRIAVLSGHDADNRTLALAVRAVYEQSGIAPIYYNVYTDPLGLDDPVAAAMREHEQSDESFQETSMVTAACEILGLPPLVDMTEDAVLAGPYPKGLEAVGRSGATVGYYFTDPGQHIPKPAAVDAALGRRYLELGARQVTEGLAALREYGPEARRHAIAWVRGEQRGRIVY